jgi:hypothetical protein
LVACDEDADGRFRGFVRQHRGADPHFQAILDFRPLISPARNKKIDAPSTAVIQLPISQNR